MNPLFTDPTLAQRRLGGPVGTAVVGVAHESAGPDELVAPRARKAADAAVRMRGRVAETCAVQGRAGVGAGRGCTDGGK